MEAVEKNDNLNFTPHVDSFAVSQSATEVKLFMKSLLNLQNG
jgi:hypothetical protein